MANMVDGGLEARLPEFHIFAPAPTPEQMLELQRNIVSGNFTMHAMRWLLRSIQENTLPFTTDHILAKEYERQSELLASYRYRFHFDDRYANKRQYKASFPEMAQSDLNNCNHLSRLDEYPIPLLVENRVPADVLLDQMGVITLQDLKCTDAGVAMPQEEPYWTLVRLLGKRKTSDIDQKELSQTAEGKNHKVFKEMLTLELGLTVREAMHLAFHFPDILKPGEGMLCAATYYKSGGNRRIPALTCEQNGRFTLGHPALDHSYFVYVRSFFTKF